MGIRRAQRYTVAYPEPERPTDSFYQERFRDFPFWYRLYLRLRGLLIGASVATITRRHHLSELRRRLASESGTIVDVTTPALLPAFHSRLRSLEARLARISSALAEATGTRKGTFVRESLAALAPDLDEQIREAARVPEALLADGARPMEEIRRRVEIEVSRRLDDLVTEIDHVIGPHWLALRALMVLESVEVESLLPVGGAPGGRTPLRVVERHVRHLHQTIELCRRNAQTQATALAFDFASGRTRSQPGTPGAIWVEIENFATSVPLLDLARYALSDPFLELPHIELKSDWWSAFAADWVAHAGREVGPTVLEHRTAAVAAILSDSFLIDAPAPAWIPAQLLPRTTGAVLLLAASEAFHDTRRAVTQLVIDAEFYHLDVRNALHQQALEVDGSLERLQTMFGLGDDRGALGEEIRRLQNRSGMSPVVHRQLVSLAERYRPRVMRAIEELTAAMAEAGRTIEKTLDGEAAAFDMRSLPNRSITGTTPLKDLLEHVAATWPQLSSMLRALLRVEAPT